ncbi:MAG: beta galactosidase jelly roll domain-containing protein [Clostridia bacterium]|nr:beta galactosidase jelly roll domain-containing protein [Clostridia bacterium]
MERTFCFHHGWRFRLANAFPLADALAATRDENGHTFESPAYLERGWQRVALPHTFNDAELFSVPIEDAGSGQTRTVALYRNELDVPSEFRSGLTLLSFEGVRQTCYVWVNGQLTGYYEAGVGPFGFDLTPYLSADGHNLIAIATDNTSTRNIPFCIAETPNKPDAVPGSYLFAQEQPVAEHQAGVPFFWNCNDFNPVIGGLSQPVRIHFKPRTHLTLPLYSNLLSHGQYVYADAFDVPRGACTLHVDAEVRSLADAPACVSIAVSVQDMDGHVIAGFTSDEVAVTPIPPAEAASLRRISITPEDAYVWDEATQHYIPADEDKVAPTPYAALGTQVIRTSAPLTGVTLWSPSSPALYRVVIRLMAGETELDRETVITGFRKVAYDAEMGVMINDRPVWLRGYAQRATNEWAAAGIVPEWMHDLDAMLIRESSANHIRFMHVAGNLTDLRAYDRHGVVVTQPAGDKERENFGRQWDQRAELMRNVILACRNHPSILFWEAGNNAISREHMREMTHLKRALDPFGGRFMGCRTINTEDVLAESEYVGTMLNRHAGRFLSLHGPVMETEYAREEAPRRIWDDFTPPDFDYRNRYLGKGGRKQKGLDFYDLTSEELALATARGYQEFFHDRLQGGSGRNWYSGAAALCWTDSAQHGRQSWSENGRMSGRVDAIRVRKQSFDVFRVMQSARPQVKLLGHWNYPPVTPEAYLHHGKRFNGSYWEETDELLRRDPTRKTLYAIASYPVAKVALLVNGQPAGLCDKPESTFVFAFPDVDVTQSGCVEAVAYGYDGAEIARDRIDTVGQPARLHLVPRTAPGGLRADGTDIACVDIQVLDALGRVCPLCDARIDFDLRGPGIFLGGYNSGRFDGNGHSDNVIHQPFVFAECGTNRVLIRATEQPGSITLTARCEGLPEAEVQLAAIPADVRPLSTDAPAVLHDAPAALRLPEEDWIAPIPEADAAKFIPEKENYCKIMVNGQEPDFRGVRAVNRGGAIWGNVMCIVERIKAMQPELMDFTWDAEAGTLTVVSGSRRIIAQVGATHLLVDGHENLMDGMPYVTDTGVLVMEVNALVTHIPGVSAQYDENIRALRVTLP